MLPAAFARAVGAGAEILGEIAPQAARLARVLKEATQAAKPGGAFFKFGNILRKATPGLPWSEVSQIMNAVRYFESQEDFLPAWNRDVRLDPRVAGIIRTETGFGPDAEQIRYQIRVRITYTRTGEQKDWTQWLASDEYLTPAEAIDLAVAEMTAKWKDSSKPRDLGGEADDMWVSTSLLRFDRFTMRGAK